MKLLRWTKPFPYRELKEIISLDRLKAIFNMSLKYNHESFKNINDRIATYFYYKYGRRYTYEQDKEILEYNLLELIDTYIDTFYNNIIRHLTNEELTAEKLREGVLSGNTIEYNTRSGDSASPYNITLNQAQQILDTDYLYDKHISNTTQQTKYTDHIKRTNDIMYSKINGEVNNFLNSFYSLFTPLNLSTYIEKELENLLNSYKTTINTIIDWHNALRPFFEKIKELQNEEDN